MDIDFSNAAPIAKFAIAPENPRAHRDIEHLDELAANIATHGVLQPVIVYQHKAQFLVTAGRRRLHAARKAGLKALPFVALPKAEAIAAGLAEQEGHVAMHPADQAVAWHSMWKTKGTTAVEIANAFGVTERTVMQRIALATLHPPILKALQEDKITIATAGAWANVPVEKQPALFKKIGGHADSWDIKNALSHEDLTADDRLARFVGEKAYTDAGGRIERDLFAFQDEWGDRDEKEPEPEARWLDRELAQRLADDKIAAEVKKLEAQGWGFVIVGDVDWSRYDSGAPQKTKEEKAKAGCFVRVDYKGRLEIERGFKLRAGKTAAKSAKAAVGAAPKGKQPAMTNTTHERLTRAAAVAVGRTLQVRPGAALIVLVAALARMHWEEGGEDVLNLRSDRDWRPDLIPTLETDEAAKAAEERWRKQLPSDLDDAEVELQRWSASDLDDLLAFLVGELVVFSEQSPNHTSRSEKRRRLIVAGQTAGVTPHAHWAPDAAWFKGCSVATLAKFAKDLGVEIGKTKGKTAEALAIAAKHKGWVPPLFRELCGDVAETPPTAKAPAKKKREKAEAA